MKKQDKKITFTDFEKKVYRCVIAVPLGEVRTYRWVAGKIGKPGASRAVGNALHKNPFPVLIPCHRIVKSSGEIGGYSSGEKKKIRLINLEKIIKDMIE